MLRSRHTTTRERARIAARVQRRRVAALHRLSRAARWTIAPLAAVNRHVRALGGRTVSVERMTGTMIVVVPRATIASLHHDRRIIAVAAAPPAPRPLGTTPPFTVGADTWWSHGFLGGGGPGGSDGVDGAGTLSGHGQPTGADARPDLAIVDVESVQEDHPAFAALGFEDPAGAATACGNPGGNNCKHPTAVLSAATGQSPASCPTASGYTCNPADIDADIKGSAPSIDKVLDTSVLGMPNTGDGFAGPAWALGVTQLGLNGGTLPGASDPAEVFNGSVGSIALGSGAPDEDYDLGMQNLDSYATLGALPVYAAGNDGTAGPGVVATPGAAYDSIQVGAFDPSAGVNDPTDDAIFSWSSTGPTPGGRKKPDLIADGSMYGLARPDWRSSGSLWTSMQGTSFASPQVAGAALLLEGAGITDPLAVKAILLDSARNGRATSGSAMGTQTGWQADWGWGELDLTTAYAQRTNFDVNSVGADDARFYAATTQAGGDKATVTWNRRVASDWSVRANQGSLDVKALTNVNLYEYASGTTCAPTLRGSSTSVIDNVEQVRSPNAASVVYKLTAGSIDGATSEPYAIAGTRQVTPLTAPKPTVTVTSDKTTLGPNDVATVTVTATNPSSTMTGCAPTLDLQPGAGAQVVQVLDGQPAGDLAPSQSVQRRFKVQGTTTGTTQLIGTATTTAYGSPLAGSGERGVTVDVSGPSTTISAPSGTQQPGAFSVSWTASDPAGVTGFIVEVATDGGAWTSWLAGSATSATYAGEAGRRYRFRVRATDGYGNASDWTQSGDVTIAAPASNPITNPVGPVTPTPPPTNPVTPKPTQRDAALKLSAISVDRRNRRLVTVRGTIAAGATGTVRITLYVKQGKKVKRLTGTATVKNGRFSRRFKLGAHQRASKATVTYAGAAQYRQATASRSGMTYTGTKRR